MILLISNCGESFIRIKGFKFVQRGPQIIKDVNEWVQSDEFMDMVDPPPGTPDLDKFLESLNIPSDKNAETFN